MPLVSGLFTDRVKCGISIHPFYHQYIGKLVDNSVSKQNTLSDKWQNIEYITQFCWCPKHCTVRLNKYIWYYICVLQVLACSLLFSNDTVNNYKVSAGFITYKKGFNTSYTVFQKPGNRKFSYLPYIYVFSNIFCFLHCLYLYTKQKQLCSIDIRVNTFHMSNLLNMFIPCKLSLISQVSLLS